MGKLKREEREVHLIIADDGDSWYVATTSSRRTRRLVKWAKLWGAEVEENNGLRGFFVPFEAVGFRRPFVPSAAQTCAPRES